MMTRQKTFKRKVRARMQKTGESYTAARRRLIAAGERPEAEAAEFEPPMSDDAIRERTGRGWDEWFALLDAWEASSRPHPEIARWLREEHGVGGWSAQSITVGYERARGLRAPGQRPDGWSVTASKTVAVPVERLYAAFGDDGLRERWLPGAELHVRTASPPKSARYLCRARSAPVATARSRSYSRSHLRTALSETPYLRPAAQYPSSLTSRRSS